ncbi:MAG: hypothetical protein ACK4S2_10150 [Gemmobacter sp.]
MPRTLHVSDVSIRRWLKLAEERAERLAEEQTARAAKRGRWGKP